MPFTLNLRSGDAAEQQAAKARAEAREEFDEVNRKLDDQKKQLEDQDKKMDEHNDNRKEEHAAQIQKLDEHDENRKREHQETLSVLSEAIQMMSAQKASRPLNPLNEGHLDSWTGGDKPNRVEGDYDQASVSTMSASTTMTPSRRPTKSKESTRLSTRRVGKRSRGQFKDAVEIDPVKTETKDSASVAENNHFERLRRGRANRTEEKRTDQQRYPRRRLR